MFANIKITKVQDSTTEPTSHVNQFIILKHIISKTTNDTRTTHHELYSQYTTTVYINKLFYNRTYNKRKPKRIT